MSNIAQYHRTLPSIFDNFDFLFGQGSSYAPLTKSNFQYPVNIGHDDSNLYMEIPVLDVNIEDVEITKTVDTLSIKYQRPVDESNKVWLVQKVAKRSFDLSYKISPKLDMDKMEVQYKNGLLSITIPVKAEAQPQKVAINLI